MGHRCGVGTGVCEAHQRDGPVEGDVAFSKPGVERPVLDEVPGAEHEIRSERACHVEFRGEPFVHRPVTGAARYVFLV